MENTSFTQYSGYMRRLSKNVSPIHFIIILVNRGINGGNRGILYSMIGYETFNGVFSDIRVFIGKVEGGGWFIFNEKPNEDGGFKKL